MQTAQTFLEVVANRGKRRLPLERVYRHLRNRELFLRAYAKLYANDGALTTGTDPGDTVDGMSLRRIDDIIETLQAGQYRWKPARRVYIPKANGKLRPLGIPGWNDKLLQEVLRQVLSAYYEPQFSAASHGFRPGRGCHTALQQVKRTWTGTKWFIEGDIKGCFDNIDHARLLAVIGRSIKDERFLSLLRGLLAAGYLEDWKYTRTLSGVPQGGVLSPLLSNVFLNELDTFVETVLLPKHNRAPNRRMSPTYLEYSRQIRKAKAEGDQATYRQLQKKRRSVASGDAADPDYRRLRYIRYADDFLLGFIGPKAEAEQIKQEIGGFLQGIGLTMSEEKTLITHAADQRARFLGYEMFTALANDRLTRKHRSLNGRVQLSVPEDVVRKWVSRHSQNGKPVQLGKLLNDSDYNIVMTYGLELRGLANYYTLAYDVSSRVGKVKHAMMVSLAKTLASKHRLSCRQVYCRYRRNLNGYRAIAAEIPREGKPPLIATFGGFPIRHCQVAALVDLPTEWIASQRTELVRRLLVNKCELCGSTELIEVHHVRKLAELKQRYAGRPAAPTWVERMSAMRRKTLVVCRACHQAITYGRYDGRSLRRPTGEPDALDNGARPVRRKGVG